MNPRALLAAVVAVSALPLVATLLGIDLGTEISPLDYTALASLPGREATDRVMRALAGSYVHTLLEWSALCAAVFCFVLSWLHYRITGDRVTAVVGAALLAAGLMDAFHTLAADRLIGSADPVDFVPFTWALCRLFNGLILSLGAGLVLARGAEGDRAGSSRLVGFSVVLFGLLAAATVVAAASAGDLPRTMFPEAAITRPWDIAPGIVYLFAAVVIFPALHRRVDSSFSLALWLSALPHLAIQAHMAFGSSALFDHHFNIAHGLKIVAYLVPLLGLLIDYARAYAEADRAEELARSNAALVRSEGHLARSNTELERFAYVASHDLQEPLRKVQAFGARLKERYADVLDDRGQDYLARMLSASDRMRRLIDDLLLFSRASRAEAVVEEVALGPLIDGVLSDLEVTISEAGATVEVGEMPTVAGDPSQLGQLLQNLIGNALKYRHAERAQHVQVTCRELPAADAPPGVEVAAGSTVQRIEVRDRGIGFESKHAEAIFEPFRRLHGRGEFDGSGVGLALCRRIVQRHRGTITAIGRPDEGATFVVCLPTRRLGEAAPEGT